MRSMFDGITPGEVPAGATLYAGYLNGNWPSCAALAAAHPAAVHVSISVTAGANVGQVLDVETGDATPGEAVNWVLTRRHAGADPTVYCNTSTWPQVRAAFQTHDVPEPHYWLAQYDGVATIPAAWSSAGVVAKQYADKGGYDISVVADYWPGVDPEPTPATPLPSQEDTMLVLSITPDPTGTAQKGQAGYFLLDGLLLAHIPDAQSLAGLTAAGVKTAVVSSNQYAALVSARPAPAQVDPAALAAALTADTTLATGVAAAVVAQIGADIAAAPKV